MNEIYNERFWRLFRAIDFDLSRPKVYPRLDLYIDMIINDFRVKYYIIEDI